MTDWTDEAKARLEREEARLRFKAANLRKRHGVWSLMAQQELTVADDIRSALGEIKRLREALEDISRLHLYGTEGCDKNDQCGCAGCLARATKPDVVEEIDKLKLLPNQRYREVERLRNLISNMNCNCLDDDAPCERCAALRGGGECRHGGRQAGETPCPDCRGGGK